MMLKQTEATINIPGVTLIGIMGKARTGKDTIATYIDSIAGMGYVTIFPMAFALKNYCAEKYGIPLKDFNDPKNKEVVNPYWGVSPRAIIQYEGTELTRQGLTGLFGYDTFDFWIHRHAGVINSAILASPTAEADCWIDKDEIVIIPDIRFQNEYDYVVRNRGLIIDLTGSPQRNGGVPIGISGHESEKLGINIHAKEQTYGLVNSGTLEDLYHNVDVILQNIDKHKTIVITPQSV